jgi:hypothetical protein
MNTTIWKFPLAIDVEQAIEVPEGARALCIQMQGETPCLWATVDPEAENTRWTIRMVGTGAGELEEDMAYLGSVQTNGYVWHYFEVRETLF